MDQRTRQDWQHVGAYVMSIREGERIKVGGEVIVGKVTVIIEVIASLGAKITLVLGLGANLSRHFPKT